MPRVFENVFTTRSRQGRIVTSSSREHKRAVNPQEVWANEKREFFASLDEFVKAKNAVGLLELLSREDNKEYVGKIKRALALRAAQLFGHYAKKHMATAEEYNASYPKLVDLKKDVDKLVGEQSKLKQEIMRLNLAAEEREYFIDDDVSVMQPLSEVEEIKEKMAELSEINQYLETNEQAMRGHKDHIREQIYRHVLTALRMKHFGLRLKKIAEEQSKNPDKEKINKLVADAGFVRSKLNTYKEAGRKLQRPGAFRSFVPWHKDYKDVVDMAA